MEVSDFIGQGFDRVQINTHGEEHQRHSEWCSPLLRDSREFILQLDGVMSPKLIEDLDNDPLSGSRTPLEMFTNFSGLHDRFARRGTTP